MNWLMRITASKKIFIPDTCFQALNLYLRVFSGELFQTTWAIVSVQKTEVVKF